MRRADQLEQVGQGVGVPVAVKLSSESPTQITLHITIDIAPLAISRTKPEIAETDTKEAKEKRQAAQNLRQACTETVVSLFNQNLPKVEDLNVVPGDVLSAIMGLDKATFGFLLVHGWDGREELKQQVALERKRLEQVPQIQQKSGIEWEQCRKTMSQLLTRAVNDYYFSQVVA